MKNRTMRSTFAWAIITPGIVLSLFFATTITFGTLFASTGDSVFQSLLYISAIVLGFVFVVVAIFEVRHLHRIYQEGLFRTSRENIERLAMGDGALDAYPDEDIVEIRDLNNGLDLLSEKWEHSVLYTKDVDYNALGVEFVDRSRQLIPYHYLKEHLANFVALSRAFTVALLELFYDCGEEKLDDAEKTRLLDLAYDRFDFVDGKLFAFGDDGKSLLCYLPGIDSLRIVKERIASMADECSVSKRGATGLAMFPLKGALVCYPYSEASDMFGDLRYAKRQNAPITMFLPSRKKTKERTNGLTSHNDEAAFFSKALLPIRRLSGENPEKEKPALKAAFDAIASYFGTDFNDLVILERATGRYHSYFAANQHEIPRELIKELLSIVDDDNSFYFSSRSSCSSVIAREVDDLGVTSGFLYALPSGSDCIGALYLGKTKGDLVLDSYAKQSLVHLGEAMTDYFSLVEKEARANLFQSEAEHILGLSDYMLYKVDEETQKLTYLSPNLHAYFPHAAVGQYCYKALYGFDRPCPHCPMREASKMRETAKLKMGSKSREVELLTSLSLNDRQKEERTLLVQRVSKGGEGDPYDRDWLAYSYETLLKQLQNSYLSHSRGYLLLLSLDNLDSFVEQSGSEGTCYEIRSLIRQIKTALDTQDVYAYNPSVVAVLMPRAGQVETIDACEAIYDITKKKLEGIKFTITYLPLGYPQGYANATDFLGAVEEFYRNGGFKRGLDMIYFQDRSIARSASKRDHMLHIIDEVFGSKNANCVYLQPMLTAKDKKMFGAEILLRVEDAQRHTFFRADQLSEVAEKNGRIGLITESLLNFVNDLYKEHGSSLFALNSFRRIAINVDAAFLKDAELAKKVASLYQEQHLGKDFLAFEVPENLISDSFSMEGNMFANSGAVLVCDQYTGKYVTLEKLKSFGFREVKLPRGMIDGIDVDPKKFSAVESIVTSAKALGLKVSAVGVENSAQYLVLRDLDPEMLLQGYHFYKPLSRSDLIAAVISHNR